MKESRGKIEAEISKSISNYNKYKMCDREWLLSSLFFLFLFMVCLVSVVDAFGADFTQGTSNCTLENNSATPAIFNIACADPSGSRLRLDDSVLETTYYVKQGGTRTYGGVLIQQVNTSVNDCLNITSVNICYEWWNASTALNEEAGIPNLNISNGTNTFKYLVSPNGTTNPGVSCLNVTQNLSWSCGNFFGSSGTRASAFLETRRAAAAANSENSIAIDVFYFNISYNEDLNPIVKLISPPNASSRANAEVNFTCNATDDFKLQNITFYWNNTGTWQANGTVNVSGIYNITTFTRTNLTANITGWNCLACDNISQCSFASNNFTVIISAPDTTNPAVFDVRPVAASVFNTSNVRTISANVTDIVGVDGVFANITYPNGSITVITLVRDGTTDKYNQTFTIPNLTGLYNVTFIANDTQNNVNNTVKTNFTVNDITPPWFNQTLANTVVELGTVFSMQINATDNIAVDKYSVNDTTNFVINANTGLITNATNLIVGIYYLNISINDTSNNKNSTIFTVTVNDSIRPAVFDVRPIANSLYNVSDIITISANVTDLSTISLVFANLTLPNSSTQLITLTKDGATNKYNNTYTIPTLLGQYNLTFYANDTYNNLNATIVTFFVGQDNMVPAIVIISPTNKTYNYSSILVNISTADNIGVDKVWFFNGTANETYSAPKSVNFADNSAYTLYAYVNDTSGNLNSTNVSFYVDTCTPVMNYTDWTSWSNLTCDGIYMNQSRSRIEYDINNCGETLNTTSYEYQQTGPDLYNVTGSWYNISSCVFGDYYNQTRNITEFDNYMCKNNTVYYEFRNQTCVYDAAIPIVTIITPPNNAVDPDGDIYVNCSATDDSGLQNLSVKLNGIINQTTNVGGLQNSSEFVIANLSNGDYNISCLAYDIGGNNDEEFIAIKSNYTQAPTYSQYNGTNTTNWDLVPDITNVCNGTAVLDNPQDMIVWDNCVNAANSNFDAAVSLAYNNVTVTFGLHSSFNSSAKITMRNLPWNETPDIYIDGVLCDPSICQNVVYDNDTKILTFDVTHFSSFTTAGASRLEIWDETDTGLPYSGFTRYPNQTTLFFANYTKNQNPLSGGTCTIRFGDQTGTMTYNTTKTLFQYNRTFTNNGTYYWNVTCSATGAITLFTNDTVFISADTSAPIITNVLNYSITNESAIINWTTDDLSNSSVNINNVIFGADDSVTIHSVNVAGLSSDSVQSYNVTSCNIYGNCSTSSQYTFTTQPNANDTSAPIISSVTNGTITNESGVVTWNTDDLSNSTVYYGTTPSLGSEIGNPAYVYSHNINITPLLNNTLYYYNVSSCNIYGNCSIDGPYNFTTEQNIAPDTTKPEVSEIQPTFVDEDIPINYNATVSDNVEVYSCDLYINGTLNGSMDLIGNLTNKLANRTVTITQPGNYNFLANCSDTNGNYNDTSVTIITVNDITPPNIDIISPIGPYTYNYTLILVNITVTDYDTIWFFNGTDNETYSAAKFIEFADNSTYTLYAYANDTSGNLGTSNVTFKVNTTAPPDIIPPNLSSITNGTTTNETALITWITDEAANATVSYGLNNSLGDFAYNLTLGAPHDVLLTGLQPNTTYYYNVTSCDASNNCATEGPFTFRTAANPIPPDLTPPVISSISVTSKTSTSAHITWHTNESANATVKYATTITIGTKKSRSSLSTYHDLTLSGLLSSTLYYYNVTSCDASNNCATEGTFNFTTLSAGGGGGGGDVNEGSIDLTTTCVESWECDSWSECSQNGERTRSCSDTSHCVAQTYKPRTKESCTYIAKPIEEKPIEVKPVIQEKPKFDFESIKTVARGVIAWLIVLFVIGALVLFAYRKHTMTSLQKFNNDLSRYIAIKKRRKHDLKIIQRKRVSAEEKVVVNVHKKLESPSVARIELKRIDERIKPKEIKVEKQLINVNKRIEHDVSSIIKILQEKRKPVPVKLKEEYKQAEKDIKEEKKDLDSSQKKKKELLKQLKEAFND